MEESKKVVQTGLIILLVLAVGAAIYYFLIYKKAHRGPVVEEPTTVIEKKEAEIGEQKGIPELPPVELDKSDDLVRQLAGQLSAHPKLALWLRSGHLIRRIAAAVDNIANGITPRAHIDFFSPEGSFKIAKKGNLLIVDPSGYTRYNPVVDVFVSLDAKEVVNLFRAMKPLFQEAYADLGYPGRDFEETLLRAINELLQVPIVEGDVGVEKTVVNYIMVDSNLEELSNAQKHLLRMGPENVGAIQAKLREMAYALGIQEYRLPSSRFYTPRPRG